MIGSLQDDLSAASRGDLFGYANHMGQALMHVVFFWTESIHTPFRTRRNTLCSFFFLFLGLLCFAMPLLSCDAASVAVWLWLNPIFIKSSFYVRRDRDSLVVKFKYMVLFHRGFHRWSTLHCNPVFCWLSLVRVQKPLMLHT